MARAPIKIFLRIAVCAWGVHALLPKFPSTYNMSMSTMIMPCNDTGFMGMQDIVGKFGIVDYDWSNAKQLWANAHPMNAEELLLQQAKISKAAACPDTCALPGGCAEKNACPLAKVWVYRNLVKALPWFTSVREKLEDPRYAGFFLRFANASCATDPACANATYHVPTCDYGYSPPKCTAFYHDQEQTPEHPGSDLHGSCEPGLCDCGAVPCGEYLFDHRNGSMLTRFLVDELVGGAAMGMGNANIDGLFMDDVWGSRGPSEEDKNSMADCGLGSADIAALVSGYHANMDAAKARILGDGGFNWQMFDVGHNTNAGPPFGPSSCAAYLRGPQPARLQNQSLLFGFTQGKTKGPLPAFDTDLASFLLVRGPYAWLGYSWIGCNNGNTNPIPYERPAGLDADYGVPLGLVAETAPGSGVFRREWSKATVTLDCNTFNATITAHETFE